MAVERSVINDESLVKCTMTALQSGLAKAWSWASRSALLRFGHFFATHICILPDISQPSYVAMYMWFSKYTRSQSKHWNMCLRLHNSAEHAKTNKMTCAPSEDSDHPKNSHCQIRAFTVRLKKGLDRHPKKAHDEDWSDWADLSLRWAYRAFCWFCHATIAYLTQPSMPKPTKWHVRPAKTQIILRIRTVKSELSLSAWRKVWTATPKKRTTKTDQTGLTWAFAGRIGYFVDFVMLRLHILLHVRDLFTAGLMHWKTCRTSNYYYIWLRIKVRDCFSLPPLHLISYNVI